MNYNKITPGNENEQIANGDLERVSNKSDFYLTWEKVNLVLKKKKGEEVKLLDDVYGFAKSGECLAIMGGSGAGKSTLLNILSDRFSIEKNMRLNGKVLLNGK